MLKKTFSMVSGFLKESISTYETSMTHFYASLATMPKDVQVSTLSFMHFRRR